MRASVTDLRRRTREVLAAIERGETVVLTYQGEARALIVPPEQAERPRRRIAGHPAFGIWKDREDMKDPSAWVRGQRAARQQRLRAIDEEARRRQQSG